MNDFSGFAAVIAANAGTAARQRLVHVARAWGRSGFFALSLGLAVVSSDARRPLQ